MQGKLTSSPAISTGTIPLLALSPPPSTSTATVSSNRVSHSHDNETMDHYLHHRHQKGFDDQVNFSGPSHTTPPQQQEVVLSSEQDTLFKSNMYENFGDIGMNIKRMVGDFQQVAKSNQNIQTIEDMAKFVDNYPEYRKMHGNVSKHVMLVTEMSKIVEER